MDIRNIIVIGASAGGFDAMKRLVADLPSDLNAAVFIVWHMSPDVRGILPDVLNRQRSLHASNAIDKEEIKTSRIYVAPPDRHLVVEKGRVRVTQGPKENRFRPAVDPLFRSAAYAYGSRVIGVVLSGALDDGTAGLWAIKEHGGLAVVQDPEDAEVPSMPQSAIREVAVDYKVPVAEMGSLLTRLCTAPEKNTTIMNTEEKELVKTEIEIALQDVEVKEGVMLFGKLAPYSCPECHGVLTELMENNRTRYRCHTGHAYSTDSLLATITERIEENLWNAVRSIKESMILLNHMGGHLAESNQPQQAAMYFNKAKEAESRESLVRKAILNHEFLSTENIDQETKETNSSEPQ